MQFPLPRDGERGRSRRGLAAVAGLLLLLVTPATVAADAELIASIPASGAVLTTVPAEAVLTFDEAITDNSSFSIVDAGGTTVASGTHDPNSPTMIRGPLPDLAPGSYEVRWTAQSADGHVPRGTFTFTVADPTPPPTATPEPTDAPTAAPTPTGAPTPSPGPSPSPSGDGGAGGASVDVLFPIVAVAVLVAAGLVFFLRRRGPA